MKKLHLILMSFILMFALTACGGSESAPADVPAEKTMSAREILTAAEDIYIRMEEAKASGNYEEFSGFFAETEDALIRSQFEAKNYRHEYDQHFAVNVCDKDGYYMVGFINAIASGTYPNTHVNRYWAIYTFKETDNGLKIVSNGDVDAVVTEALKEDVYPEGVVTAIENGYNATLFNGGNYMFMDTSLYVDVIFDTNLYYLWQDGEGNLYGTLLLNNGTDGNRTAESIKLTIEDQNLGVVYEGDVGSATVMRKSSKYMEFKIPASEVRTGTATWGAMQYHINTKNK